MFFKIHHDNNAHNNSSRTIFKKWQAPTHIFCFTSKNISKNTERENLLFF